MLGVRISSDGCTREVWRTQNFEVNIFARQKSKARSRVWIFQNNLHIAAQDLIIYSTKYLVSEWPMANA